MTEAKKRLGQNFLTNQHKLEQIAGALDLRDGDTVIEIGAGHGELTQAIANKCRTLNIKCEIIALEKDPELASATEYLRLSGAEVITGDALKIIPQLTRSRALRHKHYKIAGNIPYYLTGRLLRTIGDLEVKPRFTVLTLQKEVAERICVKPPRMNLLAASVQFWAKPQIIGFISKKLFRPQPKVDSAILKLMTYDVINHDAERYYKFIKKLFKQPRKTILNNLSDNAENARTKKEIGVILEKNGINSSQRPQDLTLENLKLLSLRL